MPVGTNASVKAVSQETLRDVLDSPMVLANAYHLHLRPGEEIIAEAGGLHRFMRWERPILTDSGGYQVFSLAANRKLAEDGVRFQSHIDGSAHYFDSEAVIGIQRKLGPDIMMVFDECTSYPVSRSDAEDSMHLTHRWLERCVDAFEASSSPQGYEQFLYPIVQGSVFTDLRKASAEFISSMNLAGNAIGGLSVGEPVEQLYEMTELCCNILAHDKPRYLMGVGTPENLLRCIGLGVDMFDCVLPTRNARNGQLFTWEGIISIRNKKWERDFSSIDATGVTSASHYSKAYLRHLFIADEILGCEIATIHNLSFYLHLMRMAREKIIGGDFSVWCDEVLPKLSLKR